MKVLGVLGDIDLPEAHMFCGLQRRGVEVQLFCESRASHQQLLYDAGITIRHLKIRNKLSLSGVMAIQKILAAEKPDVIHAFTARALSTAIFALGAKRNRPKIVAYRGAVGNISRWDPTSWVSYLNPKVDKISCVSEAVYRYLLDVGITDDKLRTIYKGHECSWYENDKLPPSKAELGIADDAVVIGCVANMRPSKGVDILFRAIDAIAKDLPVHFLLIGDMQVPKSVRANNKVTILGFRSDAQVLMKLFDVVVVPSRREGLPKSLLEAMSQGIAPVVTDAGGMPEIVRNSVDGVVVSASDVKALKEAIEEIAASKERLSKFKQAAKARVVEKFSIKNTVDETLSLYSSLMS